MQANHTEENFVREAKRDALKTLVRHGLLHERDHALQGERTLKVLEGMLLKDVLEFALDAFPDLWQSCS